jgi:hypothetical protein
MFPSVGRIVHYTSREGNDGSPSEQLASIITAAKDYASIPGNHNHKHECTETCVKVSLVIFYGPGVTWMDDVPFSESYKSGHWSWPPKV